jgi:hypothetical protein
MGVGLVHLRIRSRPATAPRPPRLSLATVPEAGWDPLRWTRRERTQPAADSPFWTRFARLDLIRALTLAFAWQSRCVGRSHCGSSRSSQPTVWTAWAVTPASPQIRSDTGADRVAADASFSGHSHETSPRKLASLALRRRPGGVGETTGETLASTSRLAEYHPSKLALWPI